MSPSSTRRPLRLTLRRALRWAALWAALAWLGGALAGERPGVFLEGATVARAKALALDAAMLKGWYVAGSGPDHSQFETVLEEPAAAGPMDGRVPPERTLLRIRADFIATPAGVNAYLQAQEVWWQGESGEWVADVTDIYRANLLRALESLQRQWTAFRKQHPGAEPRVPTPRVRVEATAPHRAPARPDHAGQPHPTGPFGDNPRPLPVSGAPPPPEIPQSMPAPQPPTAPRAPVVETAVPTVRTLPLPAEPPAPIATPVPLQDYNVGIWAYYAEQYAREHGCPPGDVGAVLEGDSGASELHRVWCADGGSRLVRCDREHCQDGG